MIQNLSLDTDELVAKSREIAIELGYNYISTIHLFLADCEIVSETSVRAFSFQTEADYRDFKEAYRLQKTDLLDYLEEGLPFTKEAELALIQADAERVKNNQMWTYPCHIIIAALKAKDSLLADCFNQDENIIEKLLQYYSERGAFNWSKAPVEEVADQKVRNLSSTLINMFRRKK